MEEQVNRQYWLWVTRKEYYLNKDGSDYCDLDPENYKNGQGSDSWWTCHKDTRKGDLVLLYRTTPKKDIAYLIEAMTDSFSLMKDKYAKKKGWDYGCDFLPLVKIENPLTLKKIKDNPYLEDWNALKAAFRKKVFSIDKSYWDKLCQLINIKNPGFQQVVKKMGIKTTIKAFREKEIEDKLVQTNFEGFHELGYNLRLYVDKKTSRPGQQFKCIGNNRIDLLCLNKKNNFVVIEIKNVKANKAAFAQISSYMGWIEKNMPGRKKVSGIVLARGFDKGFEMCLEGNRVIKFIDIKEIGFE